MTGTQAKVPCNTPATLSCYYFLFNALTLTSIDSFFFFFFFTICLAALGLSCIIWDLSWGMQDLFPWPGIEPRSLHLGAKSLSHWITREVSIYFIYRSLCLLISNSSFIPLILPFPFGNRKFVSYICSSVLQLSLCHNLNLTYKWYHMVFALLFWLTSLSMIISRSIRVAANCIISFFLWHSSIPLCICTTSLPVHLLMDT